jgi:hypothetical protein
VRRRNHRAAIADADAGTRVARTARAEDPRHFWDPSMGIAPDNRPGIGGSEVEARVGKLRALRIGVHEREAQIEFGPEASAP